MPQLFIAVYRHNEAGSLAPYRDPAILPTHSSSSSGEYSFALKLPSERSPIHRRLRYTKYDCLLEPAREGKYPGRWYSGLFRFQGRKCEIWQAVSEGSLGKDDFGDVPDFGAFWRIIVQSR
jgi:hypothetical protein